MRAPKFWSNAFSPIAWLLLPAAVLYQLGASFRAVMATAQTAKLPVLCVGNVTGGGTGKTPTVLALADAAQAMGIRCAVASRGYGGKLEGPVKVDPHEHSASDVGDEALLLAHHVPTWISKRRMDGILAVQDAAFDLVLLDDGFQNPTLKPTYSLLVFDGGFGIGNGYGIPAGPLREGLTSGLKKANRAVVIGSDYHNLTDKIKTQCEVAYAKLTPRSDKLPSMDYSYIGFSGIGRPTKFFETLRQTGAHVVETYSFPDHHVFTSGQQQELLKRAEDSDARLITTRKDFVRLPEDFAVKVDVLDVALDFEDPSMPSTIIQEAMARGDQK